MSRLAQVSTSLYSKLHSDAVGLGDASSMALPSGLLAEWDWLKGLPVSWREVVVSPLAFRRFADYEASAQRIVGRDEDDQPCYCHYQYRLTEIRSDDDEDFYEETIHDEAGISWRLRDGRWLTYRRVGKDTVQGFFSFSEEMPR